jgi:hypothetical protein
MIYIVFIILIKIFQLSNFSFGLPLNLNNENNNFSHYTDKEELYKPIIFHLLIPSSFNRQSLFNQLDSLKYQLINSDILTIILNGLNYNNDHLKNISSYTINNFNCKVNIIIEKFLNENWEYDIRNKYRNKLGGDYIWHIDDSDFISLYAMKLVRNKCKDRSSRIVYIFDTLFYPFDSELSSISNISNNNKFDYGSLVIHQGIIPTNVNRFGLFGLQKDGDYWYYISINPYINYIDYINEVIYFNNNEKILINSRNYLNDQSLDMIMNNSLLDLNSYNFIKSLYIKPNIENYKKIIIPESWQLYTNIYVINLERRKDRINSFLKLWNNSNLSTINLVRIEAVDIKDIKGLGCTKSHIIALSHLINSDKDFGMILEDDISFSNLINVKDIFSKIFYLNGNIFDVFLLHMSNYGLELFPIKGISDVIRIKFSTSTLGYIVSKKYAKILLRNYIESSTMLQLGAPYRLYALDIHWNKVII